MVFYCEITEMRNLCFVLICLSVRRPQTTIEYNLIKQLLLSNSKEYKTVKCTGL